MMWRTAWDGLLVLPPPSRNRKAERQVRDWLPAMMRRAPVSAPAPKQRRAIAPPVSAQEEPTPAQSRRVGTPDLAELAERARPLMPMGRPALAEALGITPHWARRVINTLNAERGLRLVAGEDATP